jgi:hypothetical protein
MTALGGWENFYVIVGSSAGALIGLQFVVMALVSDMPRTPNQAQTGHAFATPTIVHFGAVLLLSAALSAPWHSIGGAAVVWGLMGLGGVAYAIIAARRQAVQTAYQPEFEDWLFHAVLLSRPTQPWLHRPTRLTPIRPGPCLGSQRRRCCCSSSAFTTPGMPLLTTSLSRRWNMTRLSSLAE